MRATLSSKHAEYPFETATVKNYKMEVLGEPHALAKGYDKANIMTVVLKVAKSNYQSEEIQAIIKWSREPYKSPNYYRDLAMHLDVKENFKKTIVFTHARITVDIHDNTREDDLTITVTAHQKEDKMAGVCFGQGLAETYEKAETRVANPPRLNIYIPPVGPENEDKKEYANNNTSYKPVMIKYIAERKNYTARESAKMREGKKYVEICDRNGKVIKLILNSYLYEGRRICLSELFRIGFNGWHEREHVLNTPYERLIDAELALGSIYYGEGIKMAEFRISQSVSTKQWTITRVSNGEYEKNYTSGINLTEYYCRIMGDAVYRGINRAFRLQHDMGAIYDEAKDAWVEEPEGSQELVTLEQMKQVKREDVNGIVDSWNNKNIRDLLTWDNTTYIPTYTERRSINQSDIDAINACLKKYSITGAQIPHFIAQCSHECQCGYASIETYGGDGPISYFGNRDIWRENFDDIDMAATSSIYNNKDAIEEYALDNNLNVKYKGYGAKYRGAGALQMTHYCEYNPYSFYTGDNEIIQKGAGCIAEKYYWDSAGWLWKEYYRMHEKFQNGGQPTVDEITLKINGGYNGLAERKAFYSICLEIFS